MLVRNVRTFSFVFCVRPLRKRSPKMDAVIFDRLHIVVVSIQLSPLQCCVWSPTNLFPFSYATSSPRTALLYELLPVNQHWSTTCCWYISIFNPVVRHYDDLVFRKSTFLFPIRFSLFLYVPFFFFFFFFLAPFCVRPVNLAWKRIINEKSSLFYVYLFHSAIISFYQLC